VPTETTQGSCAAGSFCLPTAPPSLTYCVTQTGLASACPDGGYTVGPFVEYSGSGTEARGCSDCACDPPEGTLCAQAFGSVVDTNCNLPATYPWVTATCNLLPGQSGVKTLKTASVSSAGKCPPTGGKPNGAMALPSVVQTFCCRP
jgi:hypothetical protein